MLRIARRFVAPSRRPDGWRCRHYSASKASDPLRILFCGSDEFSCASLEALHSEHLQNPSLVRSIDVVVRPGKRTGRGLKEIRQGTADDLHLKSGTEIDRLLPVVPISALANDLGLRIHERDTFTGWNVRGRWCGSQDVKSTAD